MAGATCRADNADNMQDDIFGLNASGQSALDAYTHVSRLAGPQTLGGEDMLDLARANAVGEGAESAVGGGVAVAANDGHPGLGAALFGPDDVDNPIADVTHGKKLDAVFGHIAGEGFELQSGLGVFDPGKPLGLTFGRRVVVGHRQGEIGSPHAPVRRLEPSKSLGGGDFVDQVEINIKKRRPVRLAGDHMGVPDFVVKRFSHSGV